MKRKGDVRRAKLYYLRGLTGKAARIREKLEGADREIMTEDEATADTPAETGEEGAVKARKAKAKAKKARVDKEAKRGGDRR